MQCSRCVSTRTSLKHPKSSEITNLIHLWGLATEVFNNHFWHLRASNGLAIPIACFHQQTLCQLMSAVFNLHCVKCRQRIPSPPDCSDGFPRPTECLAVPSNSHIQVFASAGTPPAPTCQPRTDNIWNIFQSDTGVWCGSSNTQSMCHAHVMWPIFIQYT